MVHNCLSVCLVLASMPAVAEAQEPGWPYSMDYGPFQASTVQAGDDNVTLKGIAIPLGDRGGVLFDTEMLRLSVGWTGGFLNLVGTAYDGAHGPYPSVRGRQMFATVPGPGWANQGSFADPREIPHGPLPRDWAKYRGLYVTGDRVAVEYTVGSTQVFETYGLEGSGRASSITRSLDIGPSGEEMLMLVGELGEVEGRPTALRLETGAGIADVAGFRFTPETGLVVIDRTADAWEQLAMAGPTNADYADAGSGNDVNVSAAPRSGRRGRRRGAGRGAAPASPPQPVPHLLDGEATPDEAGMQTRPGFLVMDLRSSVEISRISTFSRHTGSAAPQVYDLYGSGDDEAPATSGRDPRRNGWELIANVDTSPLGDGGAHGASVARRDGSVGTYRHLLFRLGNSQTNFTEIDVFAGEYVAEVDRNPGSRTSNLVVAMKGDPGSAELVAIGGRLLMRVPPHSNRIQLKLMHWQGSEEASGEFLELCQSSPDPEDLRPLTLGGPPRWVRTLETQGTLGEADGAYVVDTILPPAENPWGSRMRLCAFDFFSDGRAAVTTWNGDVWIVSGLDGSLDRVTWKRFATGLFDPLGLKIVDDVVYTHGRDQITRLHDLNGDGEADHYENFNNDVLITEGFHEFAFDLQTDAEGNFYFSKAGPVNPGGRGFQKIVPHHGTILKLSADGSDLEVYATGFRAPNGIGVGPEGQVTAGENEGTWVPKCRLSWVQPGHFAGVMDTAHRPVPPETYDRPLCWMPMEVDNSGGSQVWVPGDAWGPWGGELLHLSYGTCSLYKVLKEEVNGQMQGGVVRFPLDFSSSLMRARFHPTGESLFVCGFQGWQTTAAREAAIHRIRYTGAPVHMPTDLRATDKGLYVTFLEPLDEATATDPDSYSIEHWNYIWSENYGSPEVSVVDPDREPGPGGRNRDPLQIAEVRLSEDRRTVFLATPEIQPVMQMRIQYNIGATDGEPVRGEIHNTIHNLGPDTGFSGNR